MKKELSEMTLEELWTLFPIYLVPHKDLWNKQYDDMKKRLIDILKGKKIIRIEHIGSTSIKELWAKDIVDVMIEIDENESIKDITEIIKKDGFNLMFLEERSAALNYGYTINGFANEVFHIHIRYKGDNNELYFRDYLNDNEDVRRKYEALKLVLWKKYEHNRDAYTNAKTEFITKYTNIAKEVYKGRY